MLFKGIRNKLASGLFSEESISDLIMYNLSGKYEIEKVTKIKERKIGADFIVNDRIAIQAKKQDKKGKFNIDYKDQYEILCKYCRENNMIGLYFLYTSKTIIIKTLDKKRITVKKFKNYADTCCK